MAFSPDGTKLYVAPYQGTSPTQVDGFSTKSGATLTGFPVSVSGNPDGVAVAPPNDVVGGVDVSNNVFVNTNGGTVYRIDTQAGDAVSAVASGGSRGDLPSSIHRDTWTLRKPTAMYV
jgi:hypothetical protein